MKIARVTAWSVHLPYVEGVYRMAGDRVTTGMDAVVVKLTADDGSVGLGESGTVGVTYDAQNLDPRSPRSVHRSMTAAMTGHPYVKSPIDIAVWDLAAQSAGVPLFQLLGGDGPEETQLYRPVQGATIEASVAKAHERLTQGYRRLQVKVGDDPIFDAQRVLAIREAVGDDIVIFADANCGFSLASARRFVRELSSGGAGIFLEQPCQTLTDCAHLRDSWDGPMVMDENITSLAALLEAHRLGVADGVTIKLTRVGGITPASTMRDVAVELGIGVTIEDASTPAHRRVHSVDFDSWATVTYVEGPHPRVGDVLVPQTDRPGLGQTLKEEMLGTPFVDLRV
jgi:cis-L-3-hydroxyproline dehydratase